MKRTLLVLIAAAGLVGCETQEGPPGPPPPPVAYGTPGTEAFREADFAWSAAPGGNSIDGQVNYRGGVSKYTCQGEAVILAPETPWSRARMRILYQSTSSAALPKSDVEARTTTPPPAFVRYAKRTKCDATGHFAFNGLPDGAWYVITVATPLSGGPQVAIMKRVETHGGVRRVVLQ